MINMHNRKTIYLDESQNLQLHQHVQKNMDNTFKLKFFVKESVGGVKTRQAKKKKIHTP